MKIKIKKEDQRYKRLIRIGEIIDLPYRVADRIITKGCGEIVIEKSKKYSRKKKKINESSFVKKEKSASEEIQEGTNSGDIKEYRFEMD